MRFLSRTRTSHHSDGFSVPELLISLAIIGIITTVAFAQYGDMQQSKRFEGVMDTVALSLREAQVYGTVSRDGGAAAGTFDIPHGIFFQNAQPDQFIRFRDLNENRRYGANEQTETVALEEGYVIDEICVDTDMSGSVTSANRLAISFKRPFMQAMFNGDADLVRAGVTIRGPEGEVREIEIWRTGAIKRGGEVCN